MNLLLGDCLEQMKTLADNSVDSIVTDPPYGWRFMGKAWDGADIESHVDRKVREEKARKGKETSRQGNGSLGAGLYDLSPSANKAFELWTTEWAREAFRVLKPGGHMLVFCGPRTYHRMASGVEDAGFEIRDQLQWLFGSGFPKSHNIGNGIGTALKPANEPIVLARKPLIGTVASNVEKYGTGGLNIDESRIDGALKEQKTTCGYGSKETHFGGGEKRSVAMDFIPSPLGRWPANVILDEEAAAMLGEPSRFFYVAKASKRERNAGLEGMPVKGGKAGDLTARGNSNPVCLTCEGSRYDRGNGKCECAEPNWKVAENKPQANVHPTVKPIKLMQYLIKLVTPKGGTVLDPFMGSGSTGVAAKSLGFEFIGIEMNEEYLEIAKRRIDACRDISTAEAEAV